MRGKGILLDDTLELVIQPVRNPAGQIASGLQVGNVLYQNQALILQVHAGSLKLSPLTGVGVADALMDNDFAQWRRKIAVAMEADGQQVRSVEFSNTQSLEIDANY